MDWSSPDVQALARLLMDAVMGRQWALVAALGVVAAVAAARYFAKPHTWIRSDRGGAVLALVVSFAGAIATALMAGAPLSVGLFLNALMVALTASGGWSVVRRLMGLDANAAKARAEEAAKKAEAKVELQSLEDFLKGQ